MKKGEPVTVDPLEETARLVAEMEALPAYRGWGFTYEYPGYFCYSHPDNRYSVFFTPDWEGDETLPIEVQVNDGRTCEEHSDRLRLPREGRTGETIFALVRPALDKLLEKGLTKIEEIQKILASLPDEAARISALSALLTNRCRTCLEYDPNGSFWCCYNSRG